MYNLVCEFSGESVTPRERVWRLGRNITGRVWDGNRNARSDHADG